MTSIFLGRLAAFLPITRRRALARAYRDEMFRRYLEAKRSAFGSEDEHEHASVARAYRRYMRAFLTEAEQQVLHLEDEAAVLRAENDRLREELAVATMQLIPSAGMTAAPSFVDVGRGPEPGGLGRYLELAGVVDGGR